jgi:hypothetical protein
MGASRTAAAEAGSPWHGYELGYWPAEMARQADLAARSEYFSLGTELAKQGRADVAMNTAVDLDE